MSAAFGSAATIVAGVVAANTANRQLALARFTADKRKYLREILSMARTGPVTARLVQDSIGLPERTAQRYLADLVSAGLLSLDRPRVVGTKVIHRLTEGDGGGQ